MNQSLARAAESLQMPSRTVFTFVAEPSLEKKDLKSKDLILSTALTHISRFRYDQSIPRKQSKKSQNKKRGSKHLRDLCKAHHGCCCSSTPSRVPTKVTIKGVIENQVYATIPMQPLISPYLNETYRDKSQARITRLCEFCTKDPMCVFLALAKSCQIFHS